jgi:Tol biopolymer transport system component
MDFDEAERKYYELKGRLDAGKITPQEYQSRLRDLKATDAGGGKWMIGGQTGRWYFFDGKNWVQGEPPRPAPAPGSSRAQNDLCARCGQPVKPGDTFCEACGRTVGATPAEPPAPPPLASRLPTPGPTAPRGARPAWLVVGLLALVSFLVCGAVAAAAVLLPQSPLRGLIGGFAPLPTATVAATAPPVTEAATETPAPTVAVTSTPAPLPTATPLPATVTPLPATATPPPPTATPTWTVTPPAPTATAQPATATSTKAPPTATSAPAPTATFTPTAAPAVTGRIAYTVFDPGSRQNNIYIINADGTGATQVISQGTAPSWAPDGRIIYHSLRNDQLGLVIRYPDGTTKYPKSYEVHWEDDTPSWSPDTNRVAYAFGSNSDPSKPWRLMVMNADGIGRHELSGFTGKYPSWGPGGLIAFRRVYNQEGLYLVSGDGGTPRLLANVGKDTAPAWSPDGSRVAFMADKDSTGDWEVYVINVDGSGLKNLTSSPTTMDLIPTWLPDGKHLAFRSNRGGVWGLWIMNDDGSGAVRIAQAELDTSRLEEDRISAQ